MPPDFMIAGFPKCGTTSLYHWLKRHPSIYLPDMKEPHYYASHLSDRYCRIRTRSEYQRLFGNRHAHQIAGEASVLYAYYPEIMTGILAEHPSIKIIILLRDPVRMVPAYHRQLLLNLEEDVKDFRTAWNLIEERKQGRSLPQQCTEAPLLDYQWAGSLGFHLQRLMAVVPRQQIMPLFLEDMAEDPLTAYRTALAFLGVHDDGRTRLPVMNEGKTLRSYYLEQLITKPPAGLKWVKKALKKFFPWVEWSHLNRRRHKNKSLPGILQRDLEYAFYDDKALVRRLVGRVPTAWIGFNT